FCFQAEDGIRARTVTGVQTCALPISPFIGLRVFRTIASRLAEYTKPYVGWGIHFIDYDNDGHLDLLIANGHINQVIEATRLDVRSEERRVGKGGRAEGPARQERSHL